MINDEIIKKIGEKYRTPFYLYDIGEIVNHAKKLQNSIFDNAEMFYSMKANPAKEIIRLLVDIGYGVEVASMGEMKIALEAGVKPINVIFTGPGKEKEELEYAIEKDIYCINVESLQEIILINEIATRLGKIINIGIRINFQYKRSGKISMVGNTQFGICLSEVPTAIECLKKMKNIKLMGFHVYMGTQILEAGELLQNVENIILVAFKLADQYDIKISYLNFGGGFGVNYFKNERELNMNEVRRGLDKIYNKYSKLNNVERIIFESGRYVLAEAGFFVTKVLYTKEVEEKKYLICDGGSNFHSSAAFLGRFVRNNFPMHSISKSNNTEVVTIVGNLCTPTDVIGQSVEINCATVNDYIVIEKSGAYGLTYSPHSFLCHRLPKEILYDNNECYEINNCDNGLKY